MSTIRSLPAGVCALSLSLSLLVGCVAPTSPSPTSSVPGEAPATTPAAPAAAQATPTPTPAPSESTTFEGTATFQGAPLSGYSVMAVRGRGKAKATRVQPLRNAAAALTEVFLKEEIAPTDAEGRFKLSLIGLAPGEVLRLVLTKGDVVLETLVFGNGKALGGQAGQAPVNAVTTAQTRIAEGVLTTSQLLTPAAAAVVDEQLHGELAAIAPQLEGALKPGSGLPQGILVKDPAASAKHVDALVQQAGLRQALTQKVAAMVAAIAKKAADPGNAAPLGEGNPLASVSFIGTVLKGAYGTGGLTLTNTATGLSLSAGAADLDKLSERVTRKSGSRGSSAPTVPPESKASIELMSGDTFVPGFDDEGMLTLSSQQLDTSGGSSYTIEVINLAGDSLMPPSALDMSYDESVNELVATTLDFRQKIFRFDAEGRLILVSNFRGPEDDESTYENWYVDPEQGPSLVAPVANPSSVQFPGTTRYHYLDAYQGTNELFFDANGLVGAILPDKANIPEQTVYYVVRRTALPQ